MRRTVSLGVGLDDDTLLPRSAGQAPPKRDSLKSTHPNLLFRQLSQVADGPLQPADHIPIDRSVTVIKKSDLRNGPYRLFPSTRHVNDTRPTSAAFRKSIPSFRVHYDRATRRAKLRPPSRLRLRKATTPSTEPLNRASDVRFTQVSPIRRFEPAVSPANSFTLIPRGLQYHHYGSNESPKTISKDFTLPTANDAILTPASVAALEDSVMSKRKRDECIGFCHSRRNCSHLAEPAAAIVRSDDNLVRPTARRASSASLMPNITFSIFRTFQVAEDWGLISTISLPLPTTLETTLTEPHIRF